MPFDGVKVGGIRDVQKALRQIDRDLPKGLRAAGNAAAALVVARARTNASTPLERKAAQTLRVSSQQRSVAVTLGNARTPEALGAEFGAHRDRPRRTRRGTVTGWAQFKPWRGSGRTSGYFMFPAVRATSTQVLARYVREVDDLVGRAGLG